MRFSQSRVSDLGEPDRAHEPALSLPSAPIGLQSGPCHLILRRGGAMVAERRLEKARPLEPDPDNAGVGRTKSAKREVGPWTSIHRGGVDGVTQSVCRGGRHSRSHARDMSPGVAKLPFAYTTPRARKAAPHETACPSRARRGWPGARPAGTPTFRKCTARGEAKSARKCGSWLCGRRTGRIRSRRGRSGTRHHSGQHSPPGARADDHRPQIPGEGERQHR